MNNRKLVSVIIPLYNKEKWIERCMQSIINQTYHNIEILVINDGSTDDSRKVVSSIDDLRIKIYDKINGGLATARNYGVEKAKGKYIALIDADDEWETQHIEYMIKGFEKSHEIVLVCNDLVEIVDGIKENGIKRKLPFNFLDENTVYYYTIEDYISTLKEGYFLLSGSSVLIDTDIIKSFNLNFLSDAEPTEDINYWLRLNQLGKFVFCDYVGLYYHREDSDSIMNKKVNNARLVPPFFHSINFNRYTYEDKKNIKKFLQKEYFKKAYQNRGLSLSKEELVTKIGSGIEINRLSVFVYLIIRYCPKFIFYFYKKIRTITVIK